MKLNVGDRTINVAAVEEEQSISKHTGKIVQHVVVEFQAPHQMHDEVEQIRRSAKEEGVVSLLEDGTPDKTWNLANTSYSYRDGSQVRNYSWELDEREDIRAVRIAMGGREFAPYHYEEKFDDDALFITARLGLTPKERDDLHAIMRGEEYFAVVREGVSDEPRMMRFGQTTWSQDGDLIKYQVVLVDQSYDETSRSRSPIIRFLEPEMSHVQDMLAENAEALDELRAILVAKGVLSEDDQARIKTATDVRQWDRSRLFRRVSDLDEWLGE